MLTDEKKEGIYKSTKQQKGFFPLGPGIQPCVWRGSRPPGGRESFRPENWGREPLPSAGANYLDGRWGRAREINEFSRLHVGLYVSIYNSRIYRDWTSDMHSKGGDSLGYKAEDHH